MKALIECEIIAYDGNKLCNILVGDVCLEVKQGYLYKDILNPFTCNVNRESLPAISTDDWLTIDLGTMSEKEYNRIKKFPRLKN